MMDYDIEINQLKNRVENLEKTILDFISEVKDFNEYANYAREIASEDNIKRILAEIIDEFLHK